MTTTHATVDRLTPFECYMFGEHRDQQPMSFFLRVELQGDLDVSRMHASLAKVTLRHAMLSARVARDAHNRLCWRTADPSYPRLLQQTTCVPPNTVPIDLESSTGLRVWLLGSDCEHVLWIEVHHACCDGLGLLDFLQTWRSEMEQPTTSSAHPSTASSGEALAGTRQRGITALGRLTMRQAQRLARFCLPRRILPIGDRTVTTVDQHGVQLRKIMLPPRTARIPESCSPTINDVLIACCLRTLGEASHQTGVPAHNAWLRLCIPVNLRRWREQPTLVANCVSMVFLERRLDRVGNFEELLANVSREMAFIKRHRIGLCMLHALRAFRGRFRVPDGRCMASAVLSNLGRLHGFTGAAERFAGARVTGVQLLPPLRQYTNIAFGASTCNSQLQLAMHFNAQAIPAHQASSLLESFAKQVEQTLCSQVLNV